MSGSVSLIVRMKCYVDQEDGLWISGCPSLDVYSQGDTPEDAEASLKEAVQLWFESCIERGTLQRALQELGFRSIPAQALAASDEMVAIADSPEELLGRPFEVDIEIPAYQASLFMETASRSLPA